MLGALRFGFVANKGVVGVVGGWPMPHFFDEHLDVNV
jgi:hypothetical protein